VKKGETRIYRIWCKLNNLTEKGKGKTENYRKWENVKYFGRKENSRIRIMREERV
jgi:hypothetical protein